MAQRFITAGDVESVLAAPLLQLPGDEGWLNLWGYGRSGKRIRVTIDPTRKIVVTVASAALRRTK